MSGALDVSCVPMACLYCENSTEIIMGTLIYLLIRSIFFFLHCKYRMLLSVFSMKNIIFLSTPSKLFFRQQDEELDELSASVQRIGGVGLTIHEELTGQVIFYQIITKNHQ